MTVAYRSTARLTRRALFGAAALALALTPATGFARTASSFRLAQGDVAQWQAHSQRSLWIQNGQYYPGAPQGYQSAPAPAPTYAPPPPAAPARGERG